MKHILKKTPTKRYHLILDFIKTDKKYLNDKNFLRKLLRDVSTIIKMNILHGPVIIEGGKNNPGLSAFCIIDYSHISVHTFIKDREFCFDVFSCKKFDGTKLEEHLTKALKASRNKVFKARPKYERK
jgi:S-adenosylmethionine/arginine decarboxylase-like enzyme